MKRTILSAAVIAAFVVPNTWAQDSNATSGSNSTSGAGATAIAAPTSISNQTSNTVNRPTAVSSSNQSTNAISGSQSTSNGNVGNIGNSTTNTMNPTANSNATANTASQSQSSNAGMATNAGNNQTNSSSSMASGGGGGSGGSAAGGSATGGTATGGTGTGGQAGANISASIAPTSNINFNGPAETRTTSTQTSNGRMENVISGEQTIRYEFSGSQTIKNVPSMNAPPLTSSNDTCMGSLSGSVAVAGFGLNAGSTYVDEHCKRIKMSRELWNKGMKAASLALDCMDRDAREALEITGHVCPQTIRDQKRAEAAEEQRRINEAKMAEAAAVAAVPKKFSWFGNRRQEPQAITAVVYTPPAPVISDAVPAIIVNPVVVEVPVPVPVPVQASTPVISDSVTIRRVDLPQ